MRVPARRCPGDHRRRGTGRRGVLADRRGRPVAARLARRGGAGRRTAGRRAAHVAGPDRMARARRVAGAVGAGRTQVARIRIGCSVGSSRDHRPVASDQDRDAHVPRSRRADLAGLPLERLVNVPIVMVRAFGRTAVTAADLGEPDRLWGRAVLVHTGWARYWGTEAYLDLDCPHLTVDAVDVLVNGNAALVGIDSLNIDNPNDPSRPAHHGLLGADIPIVEHLTNLESVPDTGARLIALPAPVVAMASFPIRAVAVYDG